MDEARDEMRKAREDWQNAVHVMLDTGLLNPDGDLGLKRAGLTYNQTADLYEKAMRAWLSYISNSPPTTREPFNELVGMFPASDLGATVAETKPERQLH